MRWEILVGTWSIVFISFLVVTSSAQARLEESLAESIARYGPPVKESGVVMLPLLKGTKELRFHHHGWRIRAAFLGDRTVVISYMKLRSPRYETLLQDDEIKAILQVESQGFKWIRVERGDKVTRSQKYQKIADSSGRVWKNKKGAIAWVSANRALTIISEEGLRLDVDLQVEQEKKRRNSLQHF
jgi:hypothetical protein